MATESEIKNEMLKAVKVDGETLKCIEAEIDEFASREGIDGKSILQKFYSQWKSKKKGHKNPWNSKAAYYLGLTTSKPDGDFFFNKRRAFARPSPPDIDSDFDYEQRYKIIDYLVAKYGRGFVANVGTMGGLKLRSAVTRIVKARDIANAYGDPDFTPRNMDMVSEILNSLPKQRGAVLKIKDENGEEKVIKTCADAYKYCPDFKHYMDKYPEILEDASVLEGLLSIFSVHASGLILSDVPLEQIAPLRTAKDSSGTVSLATQFAYEDLELLGLIKFDILAISTLTVIAECVKMIKENYGIDIDIENLPLESSESIEAQKTYELYRSGKLTGVFQCESTGMQDTCVEMGVDRFEDIMALISLYRPGPMDNIPEYCARKKGDKKIDYFHKSIEPFVKPVLAETYGILVYQEQIMQICNLLAGMSLTEGYGLIKGVSKKKEDIIEKYHKKFVDGCVKNGIQQNIAEQYWEKFIIPFAYYGFNKSHAAAYSLNSYITAFLKANYPEEFMCAYLNVETRRRKLDRVLELERECRNMGIKLLPRDVNNSSLTYEIIRKKDMGQNITASEIRPSIHCKGLPTAAAETIVANRPYKSIKELAEKTDSSLDTEGMGALIDANCFKEKNKSKMVEQFKIIREDMKIMKKRGLQSGNIFDEV